MGTLENSRQAHSLRDSVAPCEKNGGAGNGEISHGGTETRRGGVPTLRFKGFGEEWEKKRLGEIGSVVTGSTPPRSDVANWSGDFPWISAQDFRGRHIGETVEHISDKGKSFCRLLPDNTVLVTCIASIGLNAIATVPCATNQQINAIVNSKCDFEFLYDVICANVGRLRQLAGQTAVPIIGKSQFENFEIPVAPSVPEQRKIGAMFRELDAVIAGREEALGKLEQFKKAMLEKMFPHSPLLRFSALEKGLTQRNGGTEGEGGEVGAAEAFADSPLLRSSALKNKTQRNGGTEKMGRVPEVRFKGFDGEWEVKTFDEMFERLQAKDCQIQSDEYLEVGKYPVVDQGKDAIIGYSNRTDKVFRAKENPVIVFGDHTREVKFVDFD